MNKAGAPFGGRNLIYTAANGVLFLTGFINILYGTWLAVSNNPSLPRISLALTAGLILLFAATVDRFESLKGLGIEATTKKQELKETINQAEELMGKLNKNMIAFGLNMLRMLKWGNTPPSNSKLKELYENTQQVRAVLVDCDIDETTLRQAMQDSVDTIVMYALRRISKTFRQALPAVDGQTGVDFTKDQQRKIIEYLHAVQRIDERMFRQDLDSATAVIKAVPALIAEDMSGAIATALGQLEELKFFQEKLFLKNPALIFDLFPNPFSEFSQHADYRSESGPGD